MTWSARTRSDCRIVSPSDDSDAVLVINDQNGLCV